MSATIEHTAALTLQQRTHVALAKALGRDDLVAVFAPDQAEVERDMAEVGVRRAIEDAARVLGTAAAFRLAADAIADLVVRPA
jgi:hypothetical protein